MKVWVMISTVWVVFCAVAFGFVGFAFGTLRGFVLFALAGQRTVGLVGIVMSDFDDRYGRAGGCR